MALALLAQNKQSEARDASQQAETFAAKASDSNPKYDAVLAAAHVDLAAKQFAESRKRLAPILSQPSKAVSAPYWFEAHLTLGEIGLKSGQTETARTQLASLEKEARDKKFLLIARKAEELLAPAPH